MRKLKLVILLIIIFSLSACKEDLPIIKDDTQLDVRYVKVGEQLDLNIDSLEAKYDFDDIHYNIQYDSITSDLFAYNQRNEVFAVKPGVTPFSIYLYKNEELVVVVNYGIFIVYDLYDEDDDSWTALNSLNFYDEITSNPAGKFYLAEDIDASLELQSRSIEFFTGSLLNPYHYKIINYSRLGSTVNGLFQEINHAYIDGLIIEDANATGNNDANSSSFGFLANAAYSSYITNLRVTGVIVGVRGDHIGGLVGDSGGCYYRSISFEGSIISPAYYIGGLFGKIVVHEVESLPNSITIENAYVLADLKGQRVNAHIQAFIGYVYPLSTTSSVKIYNGYFDGEILPNTLPTVYYFTFTSYSDFENITYRNLYTTQIENTTETRFDGDMSLINFIDDETLISGEELEGMNGFTFVFGEYPVLKGWLQP